MAYDDSNDPDRPTGREARGRAAERVVRPRDVLAALADVRRLGRRRALEALEAAEPDLAEYALEELSAVHRRMADLGWRPRAVRRLAARVERMTLVLVTAVRTARLRLWRDEDVDPLQSPKSDTAAAGGGSGTANGASAPQATSAQPEGPLHDEPEHDR